MSGSILNLIDSWTSSEQKLIHEGLNRAHAQEEKVSQAIALLVHSDYFQNEYPELSGRLKPLYPLVLSEISNEYIAFAKYADAIEEPLSEKKWEEFEERIWGILNKSEHATSLDAGAMATWWSSLNHFAKRYQQEILSFEANVAEEMTFDEDEISLLKIGGIVKTLEAVALRKESFATGFEHELASRGSLISGHFSGPNAGNANFGLFMAKAQLRDLLGQARKTDCLIAQLMPVSELQGSATDQAIALQEQELSLAQFNGNEAMSFALKIINDDATGAIRFRPSLKLKALVFAAKYSEKDADFYRSQALQLCHKIEDSCALIASQEDKYGV